MSQDQRLVHRFEAVARTLMLQRKEAGDTDWFRAHLECFPILVSMIRPPITGGMHRPMIRATASGGRGQWEGEQTH